jgi:hypothetical protein
MSYITGDDKDLGRFLQAILDLAQLSLNFFLPDIKRLATAGPIDPEQLKALAVKLLAYAQIVLAGLAAGKSKLAILLELLRA